MIQLCNSSIITVSEDGTTRVFEPEEIQEKLVKSCIASGIRDTWIAEDIALSVEYSLGELASSKVFTVPEIDSFVVKVLREVGFAEVADHYGTVQHAGLKTIPVSMDKISDTVSRYLGLEDQELCNTAIKVQKACSTLGLKEAFPSLILEFAKHYHHENFKAVTKHISLPSSNTAEGIWALGSEQIISTLSEETTDMIEAEIIGISGISKLFPSIRIDISFANFASSLALDPPVTELAIIPFFDKLAIAIDDIVTSTESIYFASCDPDSSDELPVYMKFTDAMFFSTEWLGGKWPDASQCLEEIVASLVEMLNRKVTVRNIMPH